MTDSPAPPGHTWNLFPDGRPRIVLPGGSMFQEEIPGIVGAPYSAIGTTETIIRFVDGNRIVRLEVMRVFRDRQGSFRSERGMGPASRAGTWPPQHVSVSINDAARGEHYMLDMANRSYQTLPLMGGGPSIHPPIDPPLPYLNLQMANMGHGFPPDDEALANTVLLGEKTLEGLQAVGYRLERTVPPGRILENPLPITVSAEQWFSRELGVTLLSLQQCSIGTETTYRLHDIVRSDPDPALFVVPPDFARRDTGSVMQLSAFRKP